MRSSWLKSSRPKNKTQNDERKEAIIGSARPNTRGETQAPIEFFRIESGITRSDSTSIAPNRGPPAHVSAHLNQQQQLRKNQAPQHNFNSNRYGEVSSTVGAAPLTKDVENRPVRHRRRRTRKRDVTSNRAGESTFAKGLEESIFGEAVSLHYPIKMGNSASLSSTTIHKPVIKQPPSLGSMMSPGRALVSKPNHYNTVQLSAWSQKSSTPKSPDPACSSSVVTRGGGGAVAVGNYNYQRDAIPKHPPVQSKPYRSSKNNDDSLCCCGDGGPLSDEEGGVNESKDGHSSNGKLNGLKSVIPKRKAVEQTGDALTNTRTLRDITKDDDDDDIDFELFFPRGSRNFPEILLVWFAPLKKSEKMSKSSLFSCMGSAEVLDASPVVVSPTELIEKLSDYGYGVAFVPHASKKAADQYHNGAKVIQRLSKEYCDVSKVPRLVLVGEEKGAVPASKLLDVSPHILGIILFNANVKSPGPFHSYKPLVISKKPKLFFRDSKYEDEAQEFSKACEGDWNDTSVVDGPAELGQAISILDRLFLKHIFTFNNKVSRISKHYEYAPDQNKEALPSNNYAYRKLSLWQDDQEE